MELAIKIIEREIAQRKLANTYKNNLRYAVIEQELISLKKALQLVNNFVLDNVVVSSSNICTDTNEECKHNCNGLCKERC